MSIPAKHHSELAEEAISKGWSIHVMREKIPQWWDQVGGEAARRLHRVTEERKKEAERKKYKGGDLDGFILKWLHGVDSAMLHADTVLEFVEHAAPILRENLARKIKEKIVVLQSIVKAAESGNQQSEVVVNAEAQLVLPYLIKE